MVIKNISLQNFRSFVKSNFSFSPKTTVIVGPNTAGKTNLLESIYLLATGKSWRSGVEEEMINTNAEFARVGGSAQDTELEVLLTRGMVRDERVGRKKLTVNKIAKRLVDYQGNLKVVLFGPWDMELISGSPSNRRKALDSVLSQVDREYRRSLLSYEKGVRQRNKILERIRDENIPRSQLLFWDKLLIKNGDYISQRRREFVEFVNSTPMLDATFYELIYDSSAISESRLAQYAQEEVMAAATLVGPHRDDVIFQIRNPEFGIRNLAIYGSRGEQRMAILWVKLAEISYVENKSGDKPVLLLDDIFSELDHKHRDVVVDVVGKQQTILTTADPHTISGLKNVGKIELG